MTDDRVPPFLQDRARLIRSTGEVHGGWYLETYPDVAALGMDPAEHYLKYGAALGRDPGKDFETRYYRESHPELAESGLNPLLHYALEAAEGARPPRSAAEAARRAVDALRFSLLSLGFTERPLRELAEIAETCPAPEGRARAARELAFWRMRERSPAGYRAALGHIAAAQRDATEGGFLARLATLEILCHHFLGDPEAGRAAWERAAAAGLADADVALARVNLDPAPARRLALVNAVLESFGIPALALRPGDAPAYDRLTAAAAPAPVTDGPLVTVLVAAYDAAGTLPTTLRSLAEQSWRNLEILVLDDCSPDGGATARVAAAHAARDPRIRLIEMEENGGAYVARNRGLDAATGTYVTLHDADDWSHPAKIETQVRHLEAHPNVIGCTTNQARATSDLAFTRWTGRGQFLIGNTSSFMFRRETMRTHFGYWDTVRFSADNELIRRIRRKFGAASVAEMATGPYSFQRDSDSSIIADEALGINGFLFGVRRDYFDAQRHHRDCGGTLRYGPDPAERPFPVPAIMRPERKRLARERRFDLVVAGDFRHEDDVFDACLDEIEAARRAGWRVGVIQLLRYDPGDPARARLPLSDRLRAVLAAPGVALLAYGETPDCDLLVVRDAETLEEPQRYVPALAPARLVAVAARTPEGAWDPARCDDHAREAFGRAPLWVAAGDALRPPLAAALPAGRIADALWSADLMRAPGLGAQTTGIAARSGL